VGKQSHFIAPGKPTQNGGIESLNGEIRDELFNMHVFTTIAFRFAIPSQTPDWRRMRATPPRSATP